MSVYDVAQAVFFGNIKSWNDDYIGFNGYGNFETYSETDYKSQIDMYVKDLCLF
ncbi:hypothetical protein [Lactococcus raffinolactis]|uniref:hypothetical protein n=1 Tax=Pseudolactococcus raffinolactis TaxID=1366 RepID=UPI00399FBA27